MKRFICIAFLVFVGVLLSVPDVSAQRFRGGGGHVGGFHGGSNFGGFRGAGPVYRPINRGFRPAAPIARPYGGYRGPVARPGYAYGRGGYYPGRYGYGRAYPYRYYNRYGNYPYRYYNNSYMWGPALGLGALATGAYIGSTYGSGSYSSVSYGRYCTTPAKTCRLTNAAPLDTGCSCRVGKGRSRGQVVN